MCRQKSARQHNWHKICILAERRPADCLFIYSWDQHCSHTQLDLTSRLHPVAPPWILFRLIYVATVVLVGTCYRQSIMEPSPSLPAALATITTWRYGVTVLFSVLLVRQRWARCLVLKNSFLIIGFCWWQWSRRHLITGPFRKLLVICLWSPECRFFSQQDPYYVPSERNPANTQPGLL